MYMSLYIDLPVNVLRSLLSSEFGAWTAARRARRLRKTEAYQQRYIYIQCKKHSANEPRLHAHLCVVCLGGARLR